MATDVDPTQLTVGECVDRIRAVGQGVDGALGRRVVDRRGEDLEAQVKLLRVLQERRFERVGGSETIEVDVRVIAATHRNLSEMVSQKKFREDLRYRLNVLPIRIPPLRLRREDIPSLIHYFVQRKAHDMNLHRVPAAAAHDLERLRAYD